MASTVKRPVSVSHCRTSRRRGAPNARRIAISFCRDADRDSSRLAKLQQAMRRTNPTAASSTGREFRKLPTNVSRNGISRDPIAAFSGYSRSRRSASEVISVWAASTVTSGRVRART
jgi:hypothetical protein